MRFVKIDAVTLIVVNILDGVTKPDHTAHFLYIWSDIAKIGDLYDPNTTTFYKQYPLQQKRIISRDELINRLGQKLLTKLFVEKEINYRIEAFIKVILEWYEIDLNSAYFLSELDYIMTLKNRDGFLLLPSEKDAILA